MKNIRKIGSILLIAIMLGSNVFAADLKTALNVVEQASETKYLENDQGYISKTIVDSNPSIGEVTVELKLENTKKEEETQEKYENTEIYLMVSENIAVEEETLTKNINNIEKLVSKILNTNANTKVGIIGIQGTINDKQVVDGKLITGENDQGEVDGTANNAEIVVELTNNLDNIKNGLNNMNTSKTKYNTNLQAAIRLANNSYSNETNKILISLYDNVPSIAIGVCSMVTNGTEENVIAKHEKIATNTAEEILTLKTSNVSFILLRPGDTSYDETWYNVDTGEKMLDFDGSPYVKKLYGTIDNPTYGKMYTFNDENIDKIITENIYQDVKNIIQSDINTVKIVDYFPEDVTDNFEFSYVGEPSVGTVSEEIDTETNTITWDIDTLKGNEVATLQYKLKIKDMQNSELLNKTIATNEKVVLTYTDIDSEDYTVTLNSSPKIQLSEVKEEIKEPNQEPDKTTATGEIPQTGVSMVAGISIVITLIALAIIYIKNRKYKDIK